MKKIIFYLLIINCFLNNYSSEETSINDHKFFFGVPSEQDYAIIKEDETLEINDERKTILIFKGNNSIVGHKFLFLEPISTNEAINNLKSTSNIVLLYNHWISNNSNYENGVYDVICLNTGSRKEALSILYHIIALHKH